MNNSDTYKTLQAPAHGLFKDKGSRFISLAYPVASSNEVREIITSVKKEYYDARHHCYAYLIGPQESQESRANDDGEPSGTGGRPILGQLLSAELTNVLVVVVRYFGGIKLGVPGLINAYRQATIDALSQAQIIERDIERVIELEFGYLSMNDVMRLVKDFEPKVIEQQFDNFCRMKLLLRRDRAVVFANKVETIEGVHIVLENNI